MDIGQISGNDLFMKIAIVLLNYNDAKGTVDALKRIDGFSCFNDVIVVDNASSGNSAEQIEKAVVGSSIHFIKAPKNGGYGYGNNIGVRYAYEKLHDELAVIANPDAEYDEALILAMERLFEHKENVGAVGAVMRSHSEKKQKHSRYIELGAARDSKVPSAQGTMKEQDDHFSYDEYLASGWKRRGFLGSLINSGPVLRRLFRHSINYPYVHYLGTKPDDNKNDNIEQGLPSACKVYAVHGSLLMVSAAVFCSLGGYDEGMFLYGEENVLAEKLCRAGFDSYLVNMGYEHAGSVSISGSGHTAVKRQRFRNESENYYYRKYLGCSKAELMLAKLVQKTVLAETKLAALLGIL